MMLRRLLPLLLVSTLSVLPAELNAKRKKAPSPELAAGGDAVPELKAVLGHAGWLMTPEWTDQYQPGHVYYRNNQLWAPGSECFEASPLESAYSSMEVRRSLEAGVAMDAVIQGPRAGLSVSKKIIFDTPNLREIPGRGLHLKEACITDLKKARDRGEDLSTYYVVTSVLSARIQKQQCGSYDAKAGLFRLSAEVDVTNSCGVESDVPVAIAYKTMTVGEIASELGGATVQAPLVSPESPPTTTLPAASAPSSDPVQDGLTLKALKDYDGALEHFEEHVTNRKLSSSQRAEVAYQIGAVNYLKGNTDVAIDWFERALQTKLHGVAKRSQYMLGAILAQKKEWSTAIGHFKTIEKNHPKDSYADDALYWQARINFLSCVNAKREIRGSSGKTTTEWGCLPQDEVVEKYQEVIDRYPRGDMAPLAAYMVVRTERQQSERVRSIKWLLRNHPDNTIIDDAIYRARLSKEDSASILGTLTRASGDERPLTEAGKSRVTFVKGLLKYYQGDLVGAIPHFQDAVAESIVNDVTVDAYLYGSRSMARTGLLKQATSFANLYQRRFPKNGCYIHAEVSYAALYAKTHDWQHWWRSCRPGMSALAEKALSCAKGNGAGLLDSPVNLDAGHNHSNIRLRQLACAYYASEKSASQIATMSDVKKNNYLLLDLAKIARDRKRRSDFETFRKGVTSASGQKQLNKWASEWGR